LPVSNVLAERFEVEGVPPMFQEVVTGDNENIEVVKAANGGTAIITTKHTNDSYGYIGLYRFGCVAAEWLSQQPMA
jgi:hypothetical protein